MAWEDVELLPDVGDVGPPGYNGFGTRGEEGKGRFNDEGGESVGEEAEFFAEGRVVAEDGVDALLLERG